MRKVKLKNPELVVPTHLLLDIKLQEQEGIMGLSASAFLFEMLTSCKAPWMCRGKQMQHV
jgi:hypothetical protein